MSEVPCLKFNTPEEVHNYVAPFIKSVESLASEYFGDQVPNLMLTVNLLLNIFLKKEDSDEYSESVYTFTSIPQDEEALADVVEQTIMNNPTVMQHVIGQLSSVFYDMYLLTTKQTKETPVEQVEPPEAPVKPTFRIVKNDDEVN